MAQMIVVVEKLNKRKSIPATFADKDSIIGVVNNGFTFEATQAPPVPNAAPGIWYQDGDGYYYWGNGLSPVSADPAATRTVATAPAVAGPVAEAVADASAAAAAVVSPFTWFNNLGSAAIWSTYGTKGEGVKVAVIDQGYNIGLNDLDGAVTGVGMLIPGAPAVNFADIKNAAMKDAVGHGTFCAGVIGGRNRDNVLGVAPGCELLVAKVHNDGMDTNGVDVMLNAIEWALNNGAEIISISLGLFPADLPATPDYVKTIQQRLTTLTNNKKVLIFAACGDNLPGKVSQSEIYPASLTGCVSVGSTHDGALSNVTVLSDTTVIHAEGEKVEGYFSTNQPEVQTGTSMSTPMVAGIAALAVSHLKKKNGDWDPTDLLQKIYATGDPITGSPKRKCLNAGELFKNL